MAYTTKELVISEFKSVEIEDSGTAVTSADVAVFISQVEAYLNARIGAKVTTPISSSASPNSFLIVQMIATYGVVCRIKRILEVKNADQKVTQDTQSMDHCKEFYSMLDQIDDGTLLLPDASVSDEEGGVTSYNSSNDIEGQFKVGEDQW